MNQDMYKTKDLAEAAALLVEGQQITNIEREDRICWFLFRYKDECESLSNKFFFGDLLVNAREYHQAISRLKNMIFTKF